MTVILGIESSCDDTSAAILRDGVVLSNVIASQKVHEAYGGVVPELASRAHQQNIIPVVHEAIRQAGIEIKDINEDGIPEIILEKKDGDAYIYDMNNYDVGIRMGDEIIPEIR